MKCKLIPPAQQSFREDVTFFPSCLPAPVLEFQRRLFPSPIRKTWDLYIYSMRPATEYTLLCISWPFEECLVYLRLYLVEYKDVMHNLFEKFIS